MLAYLRHSSTTNRCMPTAQAAIIHLWTAMLAPEIDVIRTWLLHG